MEAAYSVQHLAQQGKNAVVIGMNKTALSCASYLVDEGYDVEIVDSKQSPPLQRMLQTELPGVVLYKGEIQPKLLVNADIVVLTGNSVSCERTAKLARQYGCEVVSSLELFARSRTAPVVLIAGNNGKSTVADMVKDVIVRKRGRARIGGTSGVPVLEMLSGSAPDAYIIEVSSLSMLAQTRSLKCEVAAFLNFANDDGMRSGVPAHESDLRGMFNSAVQTVLNCDDPLSASLYGKGEGRRFGSGSPEHDHDYGIVELDGRRWFARGGRKLAAVDKFALAGSHNELNILAATAILESLGYSAESSIKCIMKYQGLPYCCTQIGVHDDGVRWINDSKSTNLNASAAAVLAADRPVVLIAGGVDRGADFKSLVKKVSGSLRGCVLFGRAGKRFHHSIKRHTQSAYAENLIDAVDMAARMAEFGDDIVFSPGCEPFDMFIDHVFRGQVFTRTVQMHYS